MLQSRSLVNFASAIRDILGLSGQCCVSADNCFLLVLNLAWCFEVPGSRGLVSAVLSIRATEPGIVADNYLIVPAQPLDMCNVRDTQIT